MKAIASLMTAALLVVLATSAGAVRDLTDAEYAGLLDQIMDGRREAAEEQLVTLADTCAGQPLYLLARARVALEALPLDDDDKTLTKTLSAPILVDLERVIDWCDDAMDDSDDPLFRYYRGWAWMTKSQIKAVGRDFYGAGRDAGKGKGDLEAYLDSNPRAPIPNGLIGAYLYFTDAVPKLFQFLSKLLFLPTGDRDMGLEMIALAATGDSPAHVDYEVLDANITFFFEGRLEEGLARFERLLDRYPDYPRLALASAMTAPLDPLGARDHLAKSSETLDRLGGVAGLDSTSLEALRVMHGLPLRLTVGDQAALDHFAPIVADPPPHPDWAGAFARLQTAQILALDGRFDESREFIWQVLNDESGERLHEQARQMMDDLMEGTPGPADPVEDAWITRLYAGDPQAGPWFEEPASISLRAAFYAAEALLLSGDQRGAMKGFRDVHDREAMAWEKIYTMLAAARVAEIQAARGHWRGAANWMDRAAEDHQEIYRMKWLLQGRGRYFEELGENPGVWPAPTLLPVAP